VRYALEVCNYFKDLQLSFHVITAVNALNNNKRTLLSLVNERSFTAFEHNTVRRLYGVHGPRWARISSGLPDRTRNMVKASREEMQAEEERIRARMSITHLLN